MPVTYQRLTDRTLTTGVTVDDLIHIVITGDTSQDPDGSSYKATISQIFNSISGYCFSDINISNIHSCSPLHINPNDEGNVYFGSTSGVTIDLSNKRIGINTNNPLYNLHVSGTTNITGSLTSNSISATTYYNLPSTLGDYLPLSGGTVTGETIFTSGLSANTIYTDYIDFNTGATVTGAVGRMTWNDTDGTLNLGLKGGNVTLQVGQEQVVRVVNKTGTYLLESNYQAVVVTGATGQRLSVKLAKADNDGSSAGTLGIVTENISINQEGFITSNGQVREINTTGSLQGETWNDGDILYLSPTTAGAITNIKPIAPQHLVVIGYVEYAHAIHGKIFVKVDNGYELDELHNVRITGGTEGDILTLSAYSGSYVWVNSKTLNGSYTITGNTTVNGTLSANTISATTFNLSGSQIESAWTSYVPTWTATTSPAIGDGTIEGYYKVIGKTCFVRGNIAMGSTTTYGTGEWLVGLPFPAKHPDGIQITVSILQASVAWYNGIMNGARAGYSDKTAIQYQNVGGTSDSLSANTPFTWGTGSRFTWNGSYEIA